MHELILVSRRLKIPIWRRLLLFAVASILDNLVLIVVLLILPRIGNGTCRR
jgi:hypothetical protein